MIIILICICIYIISCIYIWNYAYVCICILRERESSDNVGLDLVSRRVASVTRSGSDFPFMVCQKSSPRCNLSCTPHIISQRWPQQNLRVSATLGQNVAQFHDPCIIINASPCIINYHASTCVLRSPCTMPDPAWRTRQLFPSRIRGRDPMELCTSPLVQKLHAKTPRVLPKHVRSLLHLHTQTQQSQ